QAAIDLALGKPVSVRSAFAGVARRYWALLGQTLLVGIAIVPLVLCFPVAIWVAVRWIVGVPALLAEGIGPIKALGRSWALTHRNWWRTFGILLLIFLLQAVISGALGAIGLPIAVAIPFVDPVVRAGVILTVSTAAGAITLPVVPLCIVLLYFDLRIRHEHFDLDQLARQAVASYGSGCPAAGVGRGRERPPSLCSSSAWRSPPCLQVETPPPCRARPRNGWPPTPAAMPIRSTARWRSCVRRLPMTV